MHKLAQGADRIIGQHLSGRRKWTVSMEQNYADEESGFLVEGGASDAALTAFASATPRDLADLNYTYVPLTESPPELMACYDGEKCRIKKAYHGRKVVALFGGLEGSVHFQGVGLTPLGKEPEAEVRSMLASGAAFSDLADLFLPELLLPLRNTLRLGLVGGLT